LGILFTVIIKERITCTVLLEVQFLDILY